MTTTMTTTTNYDDEVGATKIKRGYERIRFGEATRVR